MCCGGVALDLKEGLLVDRGAVRLLAGCEANGIKLRNSPAYVREWVARERARTGMDLPDRTTGGMDDVEDV
jgi:hypothetical protein